MRMLQPMEPEYQRAREAWKLWLMKSWTSLTIATTIQIVIKIYFFLK